MERGSDINQAIDEGHICFLLIHNGKMIGEDIKWFFEVCEKESFQKVDFFKFCEFIRLCPKLAELLGIVDKLKIQTTE